MELWIRSQDKTILSKAINLIIRENQNENNETNYAIVDIYTMGIYKTMERALEVLDEIQKYLEKMGSNEILTDKVGIINGIKNYGIVYQMPEE